MPGDLICSCPPSCPLHAAVSGGHKSTATTFSFLFSTTRLLLVLLLLLPLLLPSSSGMEVCSLCLSSCRCEMRRWDEMVLLTLAQSLQTVSECYAMSCTYGIGWLAFSLCKSRSRDCSPVRYTYRCLTVANDSPVGNVCATMHIGSFCFSYRLLIWQHWILYALVRSYKCTGTVKGTWYCIWWSHSVLFSSQNRPLLLLSLPLNYVCCKYMADHRSVSVLLSLPRVQQ